MTKINTIYIVGPTASGKTALSIDIAKTLGAEVVCADSQTIRRGMNIGTAKPTTEEIHGVPHHMLDIIDPYDKYSLADYQSQAKNIIDDIHKRKKQAVIVGGTGLYVDSLYFDYQLPGLDSSLSADDFESMTVAELQNLITSKGYTLPTGAQNKRHLINTLLRSGNRGNISSPSRGSIIIGINPGREAVVERISARVEAMFVAGFVEEVHAIVGKHGTPPREFDAIGYRIVYRHLLGEISVDEAKDLCKIAERQYAKRQMSWFKRNTNICWFDSPTVAKAYILDIA
jgi:tRNA dimethylallyltransferase